MLTINLMKKLIKIFLPVALLVFPAITSAQLGGIGRLIEEVDHIVTVLIPLLVGIALLVFFWGLVKFIFAQGSETVKTEAKKVMGWGLVALFVMISVWGLVRFMQEALLGGTDFTAPPVPVLR